MNGSVELVILIIYSLAISFGLLGEEFMNEILKLYLQKI